MDTSVIASTCSRLLAAPATVKRALLIAWDLALIAVVTAYVAWQAPSADASTWAIAWCGAAIVTVPVFYFLGMYRQIVRYITEQALWTVFKACSLSALGWTLWARWWFDGTNVQILHSGLQYWLAALVLVGGTRFALRALLWWPVQRQFGGRQALIYGANDAGWQLASALRQTRELLPVAFLDQDPAVIGKELGGLRIHDLAELPSLLKRYAIREVIVALPHASDYKRRQVVEALCQYHLRVRIMPPAGDFAAGRYLPRIVRDVDVGDLLGRNRVEPDAQLLREAVTGRSIMVTGAGGSIGRELCRQIALLQPKRLVLVELNEFALFTVQQELIEMGFADAVPALGTIEDQLWIESLIETYRISTVFHAAAYKHVPLVETNVLSGVRNNVIGTWRLVEACRSREVERFVLISSDKAVNPSNVMGATKRWAELIVRAVAPLEAAHGRVYTMVRFGNVLGSSGSVVPLFQRQIARGGPVTVTHPEVTRYFMSVHEAVELVLQASSLARGGEVFLLDMGEPVSILELARKLIRLAGLTERTDTNPDGDIEIIFTGLRPGEKLHEELVIGTNVQPTAHPRIRLAVEPAVAWEELIKHLQALKDALDWRDVTSVQNRLAALTRGVSVTTSVLSLQMCSIESR